MNKFNNLIHFIMTEKLKKNIIVRRWNSDTPTFFVK